MRDQLIADPVAAASVYPQAIGQYGVKGAKRMPGLRILSPSPTVG